MIKRFPLWWLRGHMPHFAILKKNPNDIVYTQQGPGDVLLAK